MNHVDAHHHLWRRQDLPWLSGPMIPRIFGPYEALRRRDYSAEEYIAGATANGFSQSVYVQTNWPLERSLDEVRWVQEQHERTGWPHAIVGSADLFDRGAAETLHAQAQASPLMRGTRLQLHWHERPEFRFATAPDRMTDRTFNENIARLAGLNWVFELQVFPTQLPFAAELVAGHPDVTFVLVHAGMPIAGEPWREALAALAQHPNAYVTHAVLDTFGSRRAMFGSNFPIESIWTDFSSLIEAWLGVLAEYPDEVRQDVLGRTARRVYRLAQEAHG